MRLSQTRQNVVSEGTIESWALGIEVGPHTIEMFIRMYADPIWALVREITANVVDAYSLLGVHEQDRAPGGKNFRPPMFHVPTAVEPYIEFRDYGVGMDLDTMRGVFSMHGASTKRDSNKGIGGFGIGGKSIYAYKNGDQFTLTAIKDGRKIIVIAHRDEHGVPKFSLVYNEPEDKEPVGVSVKVAIAQKDVELFRRALARALEYFPIQYTLTGDKTFVVPARQYIVEGKGWGLQKGKREWTAIMGTVPYPLDIQQLYSMCYSKQIPIGSGDLQQMHMDLFVDVGDLDIPPSRDSLEYTDKTKARLAKAIRAALDELQEKTKGLIAKQTTHWDALAALKDVWGISGIHKYLTNVEWNGIKISSTTGIEIDPKKFSKGVDKMFNDDGKVSISRTEQLDKPFNINPFHEQYLILNDEPKGAVRKIRHFLKEKLGVRKGARYTSSTVKGYIFSGEEFKTVAALSKRLSGAPVVKVSDMEDPHIFSDGTRVSRPTKLKRFASHSFADYELPQDIDEEEIHLYTPLTNNDPVDFPGISFSTFVESLRKSGIIGTNEDVYGVPRTRQNVEKWDNFVNIKDHALPKLEELMKKYADRWTDYKSWEASLQDPVVWFFREVKPDQFPEGTLMRETGERIRKITEEQEFLTAINFLVTAFKLQWPKGKASEDGKKLLADLRTKYPLVAALDQILSNPYQVGRKGLVPHKKVILDYATLIG